jgi:serine/threonine-protein kinase
MERERPPMKIVILGVRGSPRIESAGERPLRVGSLPECEVRIEAESSGGVAALLLRACDRWFVAEAAGGDLQVNGARVFQSPLSDGDRVSVHGVAFSVRLGIASADKTPTPVDRELERAVRRFPGLAKIGVTLTRTLHVGASGVFFKARWGRHPGAPVVVRLLAPHLVTDETAMFRFCRGVTAAGDLRAANLLRLYRAGKTGDGWYLISEYARGGSLRDRLVAADPSAPPLRATASARIGVDVARALEGIAAAGLVHRAITPSAVLFDDQGTAKLGDFTLVRGDDLETLRRFTMAGDVIANHAYMAPEQALGSTNLDVRADVYSLGAVMYFAATGMPPLEGKTLVELVDAICRRKPAPPSSVNSDVPQTLDRVILKALAKDPAERFQSPAELRTAVEPILGG